MNAPARVGSCWYRSENAGRLTMQIAAQRWIAELIEARRITRGQKMVLEELAKFVDARRTTQKSIAFLAKRCGVAERTVQIYLRELAPSKAKDPEGWASRVLTRRFIHAAPEPGRKADNVPSWFTLEIPERFFTRPSGPRRTSSPGEDFRPKPPTKKPAAPERPPPSVSPVRSPGGVEKITQAVIIGTTQTEISKSLHPCTNLSRSSSAPPKAPAVAPAPVRKAPPPQPPPAGGAVAAPSLVVTLCAKLFPSHAPIAHRAVARLAALGWTEDQIAAYLRKASKEKRLDPDRTRHPLLTAVWLAEREFRTAPAIAPPVTREKPPPTAHAAPGNANSKPIDPLLTQKIERARAALRAAEAKTGTKRRVTFEDDAKKPK